MPRDCLNCSRPPAPGYKCCAACRESRARYRAAHREALNAANRQTYWADVERSRARGRVHSLNTYYRHHEKYKAQSRAKLAYHREAGRRWRTAHRDQVNSWGRAYKARFTLAGKNKTSHFKNRIALAALRRLGMTQEEAQWHLLAKLRTWLISAQIPRRADRQLAPRTVSSWLERVSLLREMLHD